MRKAYKYRLFTNPLQAELLTGQLREACSLYNAALQERIEAWKTSRVSRNYYDQANQLKEIRAAGHLALANYSCCQEVLRRVQRTFQAFFGRVQRGERLGFPRYKSRRRFDSITFPSYGDGIKLCGAVLRIQGVGRVKVKLHRPVDGKIKTVTVKRECGKWYACFSVQVDDHPLSPNENAVGIDVGLTSFATLSDGTRIPSCRFLEASLQKLRRAQRRVARRKRRGQTQAKSRGSAAKGSCANPESTQRFPAQDFPPARPRLRMDRCRRVERQGFVPGFSGPGRCRRRVVRLPVETRVQG